MIENIFMKAEEWEGQYPPRKKIKLMPAPMLGVEPRIFWLEVKRVNHYATRALLEK